MSIVNNANNCSVTKLFFQRQQQIGTIRFLYRQYTNILYFDLRLNTAYAGHYVYLTIVVLKWQRSNLMFKFSFKCFVIKNPCIHVSCFNSGIW